MPLKVVINLVFKKITVVLTLTCQKYLEVIFVQLLVTTVVNITWISNWLFNLNVSEIVCENCGNINCHHELLLEE